MPGKEIIEIVRCQQSEVKMIGFELPIQPNSLALSTIYITQWGKLMYYPFFVSVIMMLIVNETQIWHSASRWFAALRKNY